MLAICAHTTSSNAALFGLLTGLFFPDLRFAKQANIVIYSPNLAQC